MFHAFNAYQFPLSHVIRRNEQVNKGKDPRAISPCISSFSIFASSPSFHLIFLLLPTPSSPLILSPLPPFHSFLLLLPPPLPFPPLPPFILSLPITSSPHPFLPSSYVHLSFLFFSSSSTILPSLPPSLLLLIMTTPSSSLSVNPSPHPPLVPNLFIHSSASSPSTSIPQLQDIKTFALT